MDTASGSVTMPIILTYVQNQINDWFGPVQSLRCFSSTVRIIAAKIQQNARCNWCKYHHRAKRIEFVTSPWLHRLQAGSRRCKMRKAVELFGHHMALCLKKGLWSGEKHTRILAYQSKWFSAKTKHRFQQNLKPSASSLPQSQPGENVVRMWWECGENVEGLRSTQVDP